MKIKEIVLYLRSAILMFVQYVVMNFLVTNIMRNFVTTVENTARATNLQTGLYMASLLIHFWILFL